MSQQTPGEPDSRAAYIAGMRALMDALEAHPEIPLPLSGGNRNTAFRLSFLFGLDDPKAAMAAAASAIGGTWDKDVNGADPEVGFDGYFELHRQLEGLHVRLSAYRNAVCERVVKGTREVTEEVPDPEAPKVTVTRTVEDVEWVCAPVLASASGGGS